MKSYKRLHRCTFRTTIEMRTQLASDAYLRFLARRFPDERLIAFAQQTDVLVTEQYFYDDRPLTEGAATPGWTVEKSAA